MDGRVLGGFVTPAARHEWPHSASHCALSIYETAPGACTTALSLHEGSALAVLLDGDAELGDRARNVGSRVGRATFLGKLLYLALYI